MAAGFYPSKFNAAEWVTAFKNAGAKYLCITTRHHDGLWDREYQPYGQAAETWDLDGIYALIHQLQPGCLVGNNHHLPTFPGEDIQIFEQDLPGENTTGFAPNQTVSDSLPLETCRTMNNSWGYRIKDTAYKSSEELIEYLRKVNGMGANLLLNIGPRPDGTLPDEALERLAAIGEANKEID